MHDDALRAAQSWFARRTVVADHPSPQETLALRAGTTIGVVLPARDEEDTVGGIVTEIRRRLVEEVPLVDDIVVVDSHSSDATAKVAAEAGARVVSLHGRDDGKGGALRAGLAELSTDLGVFLDADVTSFGVGYVTGLVAPLLTDPALHLVKAFYDRPYTPDGHGLPPDGRPSGGGRVTELVARPLIGSRAPHLSAFAQPLAGECAFRRASLAALPLVSGYGVDLGMLLAVLERHGLDAMAQADLGHRVHRHQSLTALGRMALQVRAAFALCLDGATEVTDVHTRFERDDADVLTVVAEDVLTRLLPPVQRAAITPGPGHDR